MSEKKFEVITEFLRRNGWEVEERKHKQTSGRTATCSVGDFSFKICYRPAPPNIAGPEVTLLIPKDAEEIWSLLQIVQDDYVEVIRCRDKINPELLSS